VTPIKNCKLDNGVFNVLDLVQLRLNGPWWWQSDDIDEEERCRGSIFRTWGEGDPDGLDKAYILVVDATDDPTEPEICQITTSDVERIDDQLHTGIANGLKEIGRKLIEWGPSRLIESQQFKTLLTPYIEVDQGKERQCLVIRTSVKGRKIILMGCFDLAEQKTFASSIFVTLSQAKILC